MTCSWCERVIPGPDDSHGICPECKEHLIENELAEITDDERRAA